MIKMNQEYNNLNSNNFNMQSNNEISNNQPLQNNQNFNNTFNQGVQQNTNINQSTFNYQPQPTQNYQQSINQMNMQQPMPQIVNSFESENVDNQNLNNKPPKKKKLGLIIGIIAIVVIVIAIVIGVVTLLLRDTKEQNLNENKEVFSFLYKNEENFYYIDEKNTIYEYKGYKNIEFENGYAVFSKNIDGKIVYGVMDKKENEIIKSGKYTGIKKLDSVNYYKVEKDSLYGVVDLDGKNIIPIEYENISIIGFSGSDTFVYLVKKDDKYYYVSSNGSIITETDNYGMFTTQIKSFSKINEDYDGVVFIDNENYYNARTGELVFKGKKDINFKYNILFEQENSITLYDKKMQLKEKIETPNTISVEIHNLKSGYILLEETIYKNGTTTMRYRIYDQNLNLKKEVECPYARALEIYEIGEEYFYIQESPNGSGKNKKYRTTLYDKNLKEDIQDDNVKFFVDNNGKMYFVDNDYTNDIVSVYNIDGEKISTITDHNYVYSSGDYLVLTNEKSYNDYYDIYRLNGELIAKDIDYVRSFDEEKMNSDINILHLERYRKKYSVLLEDGTELEEDGYSWSICGDNLIAFNSTAKNLKIYDIKGNILNEINNVNDIVVCNNNYVLLKGDDKYRIYNSKENKVGFEFDSESYVKEYSSSGLNVIELKDSFYDYDGKKILEKK